MTPNIFHTSDSHIGHENILKFMSENGVRIRHQFESVQEMDEAIIERWNAVVKPHDKVYHHGDVIMGQRDRIRGIMDRLNGHKRLIVGNHDDIVSICRSGAFENIYESRSFREHRYICTHRPILMATDETNHGSTMLNVHGHIHERPDPSRNHMNISVERTNYRPIALEEITAEIKRRGL